MYTKQDIIKNLEEMGAPRNRPVLCHTSYKSVGDFEGGPKEFLETLIEYFTSDGGLLLIPTHTWTNITDLSKPTLDVNSSETCIGLIPTLAAAHKEGKRSLHPTHSMAAFGEGAEEYIMGEVMTDTSTGPMGCYGRLVIRDGCVLLIGVGHNRNTFIHSAEEMIGVENRLTEDYADTTIKLSSGELIHRPLRYHYSKGLSYVSERYGKFEPAFRHFGCITDGHLGDAKTQLCNARGMLAALATVYSRSRGREILADDEPLSEVLYK